MSESAYEYDATSRLYTCYMCKMTTKHKDSMLRHLRRVRPCTEQTKYFCATCNTSFNRKYDYARHLDRATPCAPPSVKHKEVEQEKVADAY